MIVLEEITFNSLMPWSSNNMDDFFFRELNATLNETKGHHAGMYFYRLLKKLDEMGVTHDPEVVAEMKVFAGTSSAMPEGMYKAIADYRHTEPKVCFYAGLIANSVFAEKHKLTKDFERHLDENYRMYKLRTLLARLERVIAFGIPEKDFDETEPGIVKITKLAAILLYLDIIAQHAGMIDAQKLQLNHKAVFEQLATVAMISDYAEYLVKKIRFQHLPYLKYGLTAYLNNSGMAKATTHKGRKKSSLSSAAEKPDGADRKQNGIAATQQQVESKPTERIIGSGEAIKILGIGKTTLKRYRDEGIILFTRPKPDGRFFYRLSEVEALAPILKKKA